ncbi:MAG: hypothetical protein ACKOZW_12045 [Cyanobium sp.]
MASRQGWRLAFSLAAVVLALVLAIAPLKRAPLRAPATKSATAAVAYPATTIPLRAGIHIKNLYNLQIVSQTFSADGWYWLEWDQRLEDLIQSAKIPYDRLVEFDNQVELWDSVVEAETPEPVRLADGRYSLMFHFSARFYIPTLDLHNSPFDTIVLPVVLETRPDLFSLSQRAVRFESEQRSEGLVGAYSDLAGYALRSASLRPDINTYQWLGSEKDSAYSQLALRISFGTDLVAAFLKWILPLLIVMIVVVLAPSLEGSLDDIRLAIPSTALLTLVFLQQTYRSELPATPYPTFLDQLYAYSYLVAVGVFLLFVWSSNLLEDATDDTREAVKRQTNRVDGWFQKVALGGGLVWALLAWFF